MRMWRIILAILIGWAGLVNASAASAQEGADAAAQSSDWVVCNETSFILRLAIAQGQDKNVTVNGWTRVRPSECITQAGSADSHRYLFAESDPVHNGGLREWSGSYPICVNPREDFSVDTNVSCALQGLETRRFLRINPADPVTRLIEPDDFGKKAITAGLQRLMQDAGYKITRIDGISGRRTRDTLKAFRKEAGVGADVPDLLQIDALAQTALTKQELTGLTICNATQAKSWVAIGYREDGSWQSRGWWRVEPSACIRPWTKDIIGAELHLYAQQDVPKRPEDIDEAETDGNEARENEARETETLVLKNPVESVNNFCIAEGKFSALGREFCIDQGYVAADFRPLISEEKGLKIILNKDDFTRATSGGLRQ